MKIGIYNQPSTGGTIGGSEYLIAVLAQALSSDHDVEIVTHHQALTTADFDKSFGTDLSRVRLRYVPREEPTLGDSFNLVRRYREAIASCREFSRPYDLFINSTHGLPPFCHARQGVLLILFPYFDRHTTFPWFRDARLSPWKAVRHYYHNWEWRRRFATYQTVVAISEYTKTWTKRWWGLDAQVIYPPAGIKFDTRGEKRNLILSVGRFATKGHTKKQREMMNAFHEMERANTLSGRGNGDGWHYVSVGGLPDMPEDRAFFDEVRAIGAECSDAEALANVEHARLQQLYQEASIFWHAAGYGEDTVTRPHMCEHYGIVTVEAMGAGCVPVVINRGGQPEIVEHGVSGFLWDTLEELKDYTMLLVRDDELRRRMSEAAKKRAANFSREIFVQRFMELLRPVLEADDSRTLMQPGCAIDQQIDIREPELVSVVIPCYNQAHFLGEAIESALAQTYPHTEIIVVDDGSADNTAAVAARYPQVRLIRQENQGLAGARNTGTHASTGKYLTFLDADDRLLPEALAIGVEHLTAHPKCTFVYGGHNLIAGDGAHLSTAHLTNIEGNAYPALLRMNYIGMHATVMYQRAFLERAGGFNASLRASEDYDLYLRLTRKFPIRCHGKIVAEYRQHGENMSRNAARMLKFTLLVLRAQHKYIKGNQQLENSYRLGMRAWQDHYGDLIAEQVGERVRTRRDWRRAARAALTLLHRHPRGFLRHAYRKSYCTLFGVRT